MYVHRSFSHVLESSKSCFGAPCWHVTNAASEFTLTCCTHGFLSFPQFSWLVVDWWASRRQLLSMTQLRDVVWSAESFFSSCASSPAIRTRGSVGVCLVSPGACRTLSLGNDSSATTVRSPPPRHPPKTSPANPEPSQNLPESHQNRSMIGGQAYS